jgi:hypothetical protein
MFLYNRSHFIYFQRNMMYILLHAFRSIRLDDEMTISNSPSDSGDTSSAWYHRFVHCQT